MRRRKVGRLCHDDVNILRGAIMMRAFIAEDEDQPALKSVRLRGMRPPPPPGEGGDCLLRAAYRSAPPIDVATLMRSHRAFAYRELQTRADYYASRQELF